MNDINLKKLNEEINEYDDAGISQIELKELLEENSCSYDDYYDDTNLSPEEVYKIINSSNLGGNE